MTDVDVADLADTQTRSFLEKRNPQLRGSLVDRMQLDEITAGHRLRRRPGKPCVLRPDGDRLHVLLGDRRLTMPARVTDAVERARSLDELTPADLGLDTRLVPGARASPGPRGTPRGRPLTATGARDFRCSAAAEARLDELAGTATHLTAFLLVEHHGPWGRRAPRQPAAGAVRTHLADHKNIKVMLARRHLKAHREPDFEVFVCFPARQLLLTSTVDHAEPARRRRGRDRARRGA